MDSNYINLNSCVDRPTLMPPDSSIEFIMKVERPLAFKMTDINSPYERMIFCYVCGYFITKVEEKHKGINCNICNMTTTNLERLEESTFIMKKEFSKDSKLKYCTLEFLNAVLCCEQVFCREFITDYNGKGLVTNIGRKVNEELDYNFCTSDMRQFFVYKFVMLRIFFSIKLFNNNYLLRHSSLHNNKKVKKITNQ